MPAIVLATINAKWIHPSLALRLLKANLGSLENQSVILEFALRQPLKEKLEPILAARPRLLALSVSIWNHLASLELLGALDKKWEAGQKPLVVLGGPEVSWLPEEAEIFRHADYVIRGEGEESFRSLCYRIFCGNEPEKKAATEDKKTVFINQSETTVSLNKIEFPYSLYTDEDLQKKLVYVEASRGCPFHCEFCQAPKNHGDSQAVREFSLEPFLTDMGTLIDRGGRSFKFLDRSFNLNVERAKRIMQFFLGRIEAIDALEADPTPAKTAEPKRPLFVHFEMVPSRLPPALREILCRFPPGTLRLELGIQTFNPETAKLIHRSFDFGEELETLEYLRRETNALLHVDLIAGLPAEGLASFGTGFDLLWRTLSGKSAEKPAATYKAHNVPFEIQLGILKCLPGTPISRHNNTLRMRYSAEPPYEVIETGALSATELARIKNFARFWELIVNRNPFPDLLPRFIPFGENVFDRFMGLSDRLLEKFGRNWGIDRQELRLELDGMYPP